MASLTSGSSTVLSSGEVAYINGFSGAFKISNKKGVITLTDKKAGTVYYVSATSGAKIAFLDGAATIANSKLSVKTLDAAVTSVETFNFVAPAAFTLTAGVNEWTGTVKNDTIDASPVQVQSGYTTDGNGVTTYNYTTTPTLGSFDVIDGGAGTDTLRVVDTSNTAYTLATDATITSVEALDITHTSNGTGDIITADVSDYSSFKTITVRNSGDAITHANGGVNVDTKANVTTVTINGGATAQDIDNVNIADAGTAATATAATTDAITTVSLTGILNGTVLGNAIQSDSLTTLNLNAVVGVVTNTDGYVATTNLRTLGVNFNGGTNGGVVDAGATTVNITATGSTAQVLGAGNQFDAATALSYTANGAVTSGTVVAGEALTVNYTANAAVTNTTLTTAKATTVNVAANAAIADSTVGAATTTALNLSGSAAMRLTQTINADGVITSTGSGARTLVNALTANQGYVGADGVDTFTVGATTKAITTGAGNDVVTITAAPGTGGSIDAGAGTADVLTMTATLAATLDDNATFAGQVSGFERLSLTSATTETIDMDYMDGISYVKEAGNGATLTINNLADGGTFEFTDTSTTTTINIKGAGLSTTNTANVVASGTAAVAMAGVTISDVETINFATDDSATTATGIAHTATLTAAAAKTITVTGDAGLNLGTFTGGTALTTFNASGVTKGAVTLTTAALAGASTITGGADNDTLNAAAAVAAVTLIGGAGDDSLTGSATKSSTITGGAGVDSITGGAAADVIDGGDGIDTFTFSSANVVEQDGSGTTTGAVINLGSTALTANAVYTAAGAFLSNNASSVAAGTATYLFNNESATNVSVVDTITGIEKVVGTNLADYIVGTAGDNTITGGAGSDVLTGGAGNDLFIVRGMTQAMNGSDSITDFSFGTSTTAVDTIQLDVTSTTKVFGRASTGITSASGTEILVLNTATYATAGAAQTAAQTLFGNNDNAAEAIVFWEDTSGNLNLSTYSDSSADATANGTLQASMIKLVGLTIANVGALIDATDIVLI